MKKIFICLLAVAAFLTGCSQIREDKTESGGSDSTNILGISDVSDSANHIEDCEAPGRFTNVNDFYKFAISGSRNPEDYTGRYTAKYIGWYSRVDSKALLKIEDLFDDADITDNVETILIDYADNNYCHYSYVLKSDLIITVEYWTEGMTIETMTDVLREEGETFVLEDDQTQFSIASQDDRIYVKEINGITIYRQMVKEYEGGNYFAFTTLIDGYKISIMTYWFTEYSSQDQMLNDPTNQFAKAFLTDSELPNAIGTLKSCIDGNK